MFIMAEIPALPHFVSLGYYFFAGNSGLKRFFYLFMCGIISVFRPLTHRFKYIYPFLSRLYCTASLFSIEASQSSEAALGRASTGAVRCEARGGCAVVKALAPKRRLNGHLSGRGFDRGHISPGTSYYS